MILFHEKSFNYNLENSFTLNLKLILIVFIIVLTYNSCEKNHDEADSYEPQMLDDGWSVSKAVEQGIDPHVLDDIYEDAKKLDNIYSLLVVRNGYLIAEKYFNGHSVSDASSTASVTKSVVSALTGIAIEMKLISSTDKKLKDFFPEIDWKSADPRKSLITIEQVLQMRSGYPWEELYGFIETLRSSSNWLPFLNDFQLTSDPGTEFGYSNFTAHMMGIIISRSTNESLLSFLRSQLFNSMGISVPFWPTDALGYYYGSGDIFMTPRSLAKFGQLYLDEGVWNNVRYVSSEWISKSLQIYSPTTYSREILTHIHHMGYGYMWWHGTSGDHDIWFAWGHGGQLVVIISDLNMVVVSSASIPPGVDNEAWQNTKKIMELVGRLIELL